MRSMVTALRRQGFGVNHEMSNWFLASKFKTLKKLWVHGRLTTRNLDVGRLAFVRDCTIQHVLDLLRRSVCLSVWPAARVTSATTQVAVAA